jgi:hypothetical protein
MHYRGHHIQCHLHHPDGKKERILSIPDWNINWQMMYRFENPRRVSKGTEMVCDAVFDNSSRNPANPNPMVAVPRGGLSEEEMLNIYFSFSFVQPHRTERLQNREAVYHNRRLVPLRKLKSTITKMMPL